MITSKIQSILNFENVRAKIGTTIYLPMYKHIKNDKNKCEQKHL